MKTLGLAILVLVLGLSFASAQPAPAAPNIHVYAEPSVVVAFPGNLDTAAGMALAVGATLNGRHSVEADVIYFKSGNDGFDIRFIPVLASYRFAVPLQDHISLSFGPAIGATFERGDFGRDTTVLTAGVVGGLSYVLAPGVTVEGKAYGLYLDDSEFSTGYRHVRLSSGWITLLTLGLRVRF